MNIDPDHVTPYFETTVQHLRNEELGKLSLTIRFPEMGFGPILQNLGSPHIDVPIDDRTSSMAPNELRDLFVSSMCLDMTISLDLIETRLKVLKELHEKNPTHLDPSFERRLVRMMVLMEEVISQ